MRENVLTELSSFVKLPGSTTHRLVKGRHADKRLEWLGFVQVNDPCPIALYQMDDLLRDGMRNMKLAFAASPQPFGTGKDVPLQPSAFPPLFQE